MHPSLQAGWEKSRELFACGWSDGTSMNKLHTEMSVLLRTYIHIHTYRPILPVWRGFDLGLVATMAEAVA